MHYVNEYVDDLPNFDDLKVGNIFGCSKSGMLTNNVKLNISNYFKNMKRNEIDSKAHKPKKLG